MTPSTTDSLPPAGPSGWRAGACLVLLLAATATAAGERSPLAFAYRSFWPEFRAMRQFKEAGVDTVCIFAANTANSLGTPYSTYPPVWRWFGRYPARTGLQ